MRAIYVADFDAENPLRALRIGELEVASPPEGWVPVRVVASALNHHDVWSLRGVGLAADALPMILGTDAAGVDADGNDVVVHAVIGQPVHGDETLDPNRTLLSERHPGTLAEWVWVPQRNVIPKPAGLSFAEAACLPTAWLTAYRALFVKGRLSPDSAVLVQGAGGGVATAATLLAVAVGARVYVTSRSAGKRERVAELGATAIVAGGRLPERVDVVVDTVGEPTIEHSLAACDPGGRVVLIGATGGYEAVINLRRVFFKQLEIVGSTMGTAAELRALISLLSTSGIRPIIDSVFPFDDAHDAFSRMVSGDFFGKIVLSQE